MIHVICLSYSSDSLPNYQLSRCFLYWDGQCRMRTSTQISNNISRPLGNWHLDWTCTLCFDGLCENGNAFSSISSHPPMFFHFFFQLFEWHVPSCSFLPVFQIMTYHRGLMKNAFHIMFCQMLAKYIQVTILTFWDPQSFEDRKIIPETT